MAMAKNIEFLEMHSKFYLISSIDFTIDCL